MNLPKLIDYFVHIPPGSSSDAFCETIITWKNTSFEFTTRGFDTDQTVSAIKATEKITGKKVNYKFSQRREGDPPELIASSEKARITLKWEPNISNIETIIKHAWAWEKKRFG